MLTKSQALSRISPHGTADGTGFMCEIENLWACKRVKIKVTGFSYWLLRKPNKEFRAILERYALCILNLEIFPSGA